MARLTRAQVRFVAKLTFSALLLWLVLTKVDFHGIFTRLRTANFRWLLWAVAAGPVVIALSARRWQVLSQGLLSFNQAFRYTWIGLFFGSVMPGMVSGDLAKGLALAAKSAHTRDERLPVSILFDKLIGLWALLVMFCVVALTLLATRPELMAGIHRLVLAGIAVTFAGLAAGVGILHPLGAGFVRRAVKRLPYPRLHTFAHRLLDAVAQYASRPALIGQALLLSLIIHVINSLVFWFLLQSLAVPASLWFAAAIYPLLSLLLAVPISISGIGVRDVFLVTFFRAFGLNAESGAAFSWLLLGLSVPSVAVGALIQLWEVFRK
jgi:glycosyltransferase 2 family protein